MLMYTNVHKQVFHFCISFFLLTISYHPPSWYLTSHYIIWCNIISYRYSSDLFANYASTSSYRWVSYVMFTCWLSCSYRYTVPYIYVHSLIVVSLIAFFLSMHLVYMLTCRLSFSYLYISYIIFSLVDCRVPIDAPVCICALVDCRFPSMHHVCICSNVDCIISTISFPIPIDWYW